MVLDLDSLIDRLLCSALTSNGNSMETTVREEELIELCAESRSLFLSEPSLLDLDSNIIVCGDIHGQFSDLLRIFNRCGFPPKVEYLFLGDYVDRGNYSLETISLLFCYKRKFGNGFWLLRGNHECAAINRVYGFYAECKSRYSVRLWQIFQDTFNCLPFAALIESRIFCVHGGLSQNLRDWKQIRETRRPIDPPTPSLLIDLLWSDPECSLMGWQPSPRGVSFVFGSDVVKRFCAKMDIDLIIRAHQVVQDGYEFFADRKLVTIFSAPHYCGEFDNSASVLRISSQMECSFEIFKSVDRDIRIRRK